MELRTSAVQVFAAVVLASAVTACDGRDKESIVLPEGREESTSFTEFSERVKTYLADREKAESTVPELKETSDPAKVTAREKALADAIRTVRAGVQQGDIFTPPTTTEFRRVIAADFQSRAPEDRTAVLHEVPMKVPPRINTDYPTTLPLATVPPSLLVRLPALPDALEYRFLGRHFILRDTKANVIVDFIPDAVPMPE